MRRITWIALATLVAGLVIGAALPASMVDRFVTVLEPIGGLWVNAVRMTVVPLVVSMLVVAVGSSETLRSMGRLGGTALLVFLGLIIIVGVITALAAPPLFAMLDIDAGASESLRRTAAAGAQQLTATVGGMGGFAQRLLEIVPANPIRAAADGAMLPLVVFTIVFGAALSRLPAEIRDTPIRFFHGVAEAMLVVIRWVFVAAPIGVFALAVVVGARLGYAAVTAVGFYVAAFAAAGVANPTRGRC